MKLSHLALPLILSACTPDPEIQAFQGPEGVLTLPDDAGEVLWIVTHLQVKNAPGPGGRFGDHATAVGNDLYDNPRPGWLGASFRNVGRLNWWTITAWETDEAMLEWVVSEPHASAMAGFTDVAVAGENVWHRRPSSDGVLDWPTALELLTTPDFSYAP